MGRKIKSVMLVVLTVALVIIGKNCIIVDLDGCSQTVVIPSPTKDSGLTRKGEKSYELSLDFTDEQIKEWKKAEKDSNCSKLMNGGYYLHIHGRDYPVIFNYGVISSFDAPSDVLTIYNALYLDSELDNRCAVYRYDHWSDDLYNAKFLLYGGGRPQYGSVLYVSENRPTDFYINVDYVENPEQYGKTRIVAGNVCVEVEIDDVFKLKTQIGCNEYVYKIGDIYIDDTINTIRKIYNCLKARRNPALDSGANRNRFLQYTGMWQDDLFYMDTYGHPILNIKAIPKDEDSNYKNTQSYYTAHIDYGENIPSETINVVISDEEKAFFDEYVRDGIENRGFIIENDEYGRVEKYSYSDDNGEEVVCRVVYSFAELTENLQPVISSDKCASGYTWSEYDLNVRIRRYENNDLSFTRYTRDDLTEIKDVDKDSIEEFYAGKKSNLNLKDIYVNAVWTTSWRKIAVHSEGVNSPTELIVFGDRATELPAQRLAGYRFEGWYADESCSGEKITKVGYNDGYTDVYAKFTKADYYVLSFEQYEGNAFEDVKYTYGDEFKLPILFKSYYKFVGWCTDPDLKSEAYTVIASDFFGDYKLYPKFEPLLYTITVTIDDEDVVTDVLYDEEFSLPIGKFDENKYEFIGYFDDNGVQYTDENGDSLAPFSSGFDLRLYAKYREIN